MKKLIIAAAALAVAVSAADAGTPWIKHRQDRQFNKINRGLVTGRLTTGEGLRLLHGQVRVANMRNNAKADGVVTLGERLRITGAQTWQGLRIYGLKHN
jgi:hypothetical protein